MLGSPRFVHEAGALVGLAGVFCRFDGRSDAPTSALPLFLIRGQLIKQLTLLRGRQLFEAVEQQLVDRPGRGPKGA